MKSGKFTFQQLVPAADRAIRARDRPSLAAAGGIGGGGGGGDGGGGASRKAPWNSATIGGRMMLRASQSLLPIGDGGGGGGCATLPSVGGGGGRQRPEVVDPAVQITAMEREIEILQLQLAFEESEYKEITAQKAARRFELDKTLNDIDAEHARSARSREQHDAQLQEVRMLEAAMENERASLSKTDEVVQTDKLNIVKHTTQFVNLERSAASMVGEAGAAYQSLPKARAAKLESDLKAINKKVADQTREHARVSQQRLEHEAIHAAVQTNIEKTESKLKEQREYRNKLKSRCAATLAANKERQAAIAATREQTIKLNGEAKELQLALVCELAELKLTGDEDHDGPHRTRELEVLQQQHERAKIEVQQTANELACLESELKTAKEQGQIQKTSAANLQTVLNNMREHEEAEAKEMAKDEEKHRIEQATLQKFKDLQALDETTNSVAKRAEELAAIQQSHATSREEFRIKTGAASSVDEDPAISASRKELATWTERIAKAQAQKKMIDDTCQRLASERGDLKARVARLKRHGSKGSIATKDPQARERYQEELKSEQILKEMREAARNQLQTTKRKEEEAAAALEKATHDQLEAMQTAFVALFPPKPKSKRKRKS